MGKLVTFQDAGEADTVPAAAVARSKVLSDAKAASDDSTFALPSTDTVWQLWLAEQLPHEQGDLDELMAVIQVGLCCGIAVLQFTCKCGVVGCGDGGCARLQCHATSSEFNVWQVNAARVVRRVVR